MISAPTSIVASIVAAIAAMLVAAPVLAADAKAAFVSRCGMCHQASGEGLAGQFPKLAGRAAAIAQAPAGRRYMALVVLGGMAGRIEVEGKALNGVMPGMASLTDAEIAEVLSHVATLGKPAKAAKPFKAAEIAAVRAEGKATMGGNKELRSQLIAEGVIK